MLQQLSMGKCNIGLCQGMYSPEKEWHYRGMKNRLSTGGAAPGAIEALARRLGHEFAEPCLLELALSHSSWANEAGRPGRHNERLEFLGDAALELCVSAELFRRFPDAREGDLTRLRASLVNEKSLAALAREAGIDKALRLGAGEESQGGRKRDAILCDAFEAALGAVFEDGGFAAVRKTVALSFEGRWPGTLGEEKEQDSKTRLQSVVGKLFGANPLYSLESAHGPEHAKIFEAMVRLPDGREFRASAASRKLAEREAAARALEMLAGKGK